jgi:hypothetical protein
VTSSTLDATAVGLLLRLIAELSLSPLHAVVALHLIAQRDTPDDAVTLDTRALANAWQASHRSVRRVPLDFLQLGLVDHLGRGVYLLSKLDAALDELAAEEVARR